MPIFKKNKSKLVPIKEKGFALEKDIQILTENNLEEIFGLEFVSAEFYVSGLFIDTLAYSPETNSFIIIEYKKDKSLSVVDQGFAYLALMLNSKADFILEYNEKKEENLKRDDIDWSQARVFFVSPTFTKYQQGAINFKNIPIELWQVTGYENDLVLYNHLEAESAAESIKKLGKGKDIEKVSREVRNYTEEDVIGKNKMLINLYEELKEKIKLIDPEIVTKPTKGYVGFRFPDNWRLIFNIRRGWISNDKGKGLLVELSRSKPEDYKDPEKKLAYVKNSKKNFNQHLSRMYLYTEDDIKYASLILKQAHDRFKTKFYSKE